MRLLALPTSALLALLVAAACQSSAPSAPASAPTPEPEPVPESVAPDVQDEEPSTLDGIFTVAQAERGAAVFTSICADCHETVEWQDDAFRARWDGESIWRFWHYIYEQMPDGEPPYTLPRQQVTDVLTYILQLNGLPPGDMELGSDDDSIDDHWLRWPG